MIKAGVGGGVGAAAARAGAAMEARVDPRRTFLELINSVNSVFRYHSTNWYRCVVLLCLYEGTGMRLGETPRREAEREQP